MAFANDIVLIYFEDEPVTYARVESIEPDVKKDWFIITLLFLQVPRHTVSWILRDIYIIGSEFTMDGKRIRIEKIPPPETKNSDDEKIKKNPDVISLADRKKN